MYLLSRFSSSFLARADRTVEASSFLATTGTMMMLLGGVWDSISHELRIPDTFWTIQHETIYSGAMLVACSAVGACLVQKRVKNRVMRRGMAMIIVGAVLQLGGGYADYNFHEVYGIDGLVTPSHLTVETGLLLSAVGSFLTISKSEKWVLRRMAPISMLAILLAAAWIGFNLVLLAGSVVLCVPVFQLFYSGCAVM